MEAHRADGVFQGGGVKGLALVGALEEFADQQAHPENYVEDWVQLAGTSAGAIVAAYLACGHTAAETVDLIKETNFEEFEDWGPGGPVLSGVLNLMRHHGLAPGKRFHDWFSEKIDDKTFGDIAAGERTLRIIATDITRREMLVLPEALSEYSLTADGAPIEPSSFRVADAVRMSMSIPYFFQPVELFHKETGQSTIVDGGVLSNFPVWIFDVDHDAKRPTFGFKLVGEEPPAAAWTPSRKGSAGRSQRESTSSIPPARRGTSCGCESPPTCAPARSRRGTSVPPSSSSNRPSATNSWRTVGTRRGSSLLNGTQPPTKTTTATASPSQTPTARRRRPRRDRVPKWPETSRSKRRKDEETLKHALAAVRPTAEAKAYIEDRVLPYAAFCEDQAWSSRVGFYWLRIPAIVIATIVPAPDRREPRNARADHRHRPRGDGRGAEHRRALPQRGGPLTALPVARGAPEERDVGLCGQSVALQQSDGPHLSRRRRIRPRNGRIGYVHLLCGMFTGHLDAKRAPEKLVSRHGVGFILSSDEIWGVLMSDELRQERREKDEAGAPEDVRTRTTISDGGHDEFEDFENLTRKLVNTPKQEDQPARD